MAVGVAELTHRLLPHMVEQRWGRIINVTSVGGLFPGAPSMALYTASKSFVHKLSEAIAGEYAAEGVHCTVSAPGATETELFEVVGVEDYWQNNLLPQISMMRCETVVRQAYAACMSGQKVVVHGAPNKVWAATLLHTPRAIRYRLVGFLSKMQPPPATSVPLASVGERLSLGLTVNLLPAGVLGDDLGRAACSAQAWRRPLPRCAPRSHRSPGRWWRPDSEGTRFRRVGSGPPMMAVPLLPAWLHSQGRGQPVSGRSGRIVILTDAIATAILSVVLIFFCLYATVELLNAAVFTLDWYRPLILTFGVMFGFSAFVSTVALVRHFTVSAIGTLATSLFFALALLANPRIQVVLVGAWLLTNMVAGALAYRRRATSGTSPPSHHMIFGHAILSIGFLPAMLVQGKLLSAGILFQGKLFSGIALIVGVAVGLFFVLVFVIRMPSSVEVAAPEDGLPSQAGPEANRSSGSPALCRDASGPDRRSDSRVYEATHFGEKEAEKIPLLAGHFTIEPEVVIELLVRRVSLVK